MTKERFEELALIMAKVEFNTDWECDDWETQSEKWKNDYANGRRAALAAVYPLIRDEVIDECVQAADIACLEPSFENSTVTAVRNGFWFAIRAIRALKSKEPKL